MVDVQNQRAARGPDLGSVLADAWNSGAPEFFEICSLAFCDSQPESVFESALRRIGSKGRLPFVRGLYESAGMSHRMLALPDGGQAMAELALFAIPVQGTEADIERLACSPGALRELTAILRETGFAHRDSTVLLCPAPVDSVSSVSLQPWGLRSIAETMLDAAAGVKERGEVEDRVRGILRPPGGPCEPGTDRYVTRLLLGARFFRADAIRGGPQDLLSGSRGHGVTAARLEAERDESGSAFIEQACGMAGRHGLRLMFDSPGDWLCSLGRLGRLMLQGAFALESSLMGHDFSAGAEMHVHMGPHVFTFMVRDGEQWFGPRRIPAALADFGTDEIAGWVRGRFRSAVFHDDLDDLRQAGRLTPN